MSPTSARSLALVFATAALFAAPTQAQAACSEPSGLCMDPVKGSKWEPDSSLSAKQLKAKRKGTGNLSLKIDDGRGSVFVDGRYVGTAPLSDLTLGAGKHDLQQASAPAGRARVVSARVAGGHRATGPDSLHDPYRAAALR